MTAGGRKQNVRSGTHEPSKRTFCIGSVASRVALCAVPASICGATDGKPREEGNCGQDGVGALGPRVFGEGARRHPRRLQTVKVGTRSVGQCPIGADECPSPVCLGGGAPPSSPAPAAPRSAAAGLDRDARPRVAHRCPRRQNLPHGAARGCDQVGHCPSGLIQAFTHHGCARACQAPIWFACSWHTTVNGFA